MDYKSLEDVELQFNGVVGQSLPHDISPHDEDLSSLDTDDGFVAPVTFRMKYKGSDGKLSERTIKAVKVYEKVGDFKFYAYCFNSGKYKTFLLSGMQEVYDLSTGEVFERPRAFFEECGIINPGTPETIALARCTDELIVLAFVGKCDGQFLAVEKAELVRHVCMRSDEPLNEQYLARKLASLSPDIKAFRAAAKRLVAAEPEVKRQLIRSLRRLIDADGHVHFEESKVAAAIIETIAI